MVRSPLTFRGAALLGALWTLAAPGPGLAEPHVRDGWYAGLGFGGGWAVVQIDNHRGNEWSSLVSLRAGRALARDLLLGVEGARWAKDYVIGTLGGDVPVDVTLSGVMLAVTHFPGGAGLVLRGGLGVALAEVEAEPPPGADFPGGSISSDPGLAALVSAGYEARLTARFALGAELDGLYLGVSDDAMDDAYVYGVSLRLNWYW